MNQNQNDKIVIDLREIFGILKHNVAKVLLVTVLFVGVAAGYILVTPNKYECSVQLSVGHGMDNYFKTRALYIPIIQTYCERSKKGKLPTPKDFIKENVTFTQSRNSNYLTIAVRDKSPDVARKIVEAIVKGGAEQYVQSKIGVRQQQLEIYRNTLKKINDDKVTGQLMVKIAEIENSIKALRDDIQVVDPPYCDEKPVAPRKVRITAVAFVLGLICGSMYVVLKEKV